MKKLLILSMICISSASRGVLATTYNECIKYGYNEAFGQSYCNDRFIAPYIPSSDKCIDKNSQAFKLWLRCAKGRQKPKECTPICC